jgi:hypothetical protein
MMKLILILLSVWSSCAYAADPDPENIPPNVKDIIAGPNLEAVLTALPELARHNLDYRKYRIFVDTQGDQLFVIFADLDLSYGRPGHGRTMPGVKINLSADGKTVTGFNWQH